MMVGEVELQAKLEVRVQALEARGDVASSRPHCSSRTLALQSLQW